MPRFATLLAAALVLCALVPAARAGVEVVDGDGLHVGSERVRLWGIDAPELDQECKRDGANYPCGQEARAALAALVSGGKVRCDSVNHDRYGRTVARCSIDGRDLGAEMVRLGWAVDFPRYSKGFYRVQEQDAREAQDGACGPMRTSRRRRRGGGGSTASQSRLPERVRRAIGRNLRYFTRLDRSFAHRAARASRSISTSVIGFSGHSWKP